MPAWNRVTRAVQRIISGDRRVGLVIAIVCIMLHAIAAHADSEMTGFLVTWTGEFNGRVTDVDGKPLPGVIVHAVATDGTEHTVTTNPQGKYHLSLQHGQYVYVNDRVRLLTDTAVVRPDGTEGEGETIELYEFTTPPVPVFSPSFMDHPILDYSEAAIARNEWTRAWLMLDVLPTGAVTRVQLLKPAGYDLDPIAIRAAFKLQLEPARDAVGHPVQAVTLWSFEWPPYYWLMEHNQQQFNMHRMPADARKLPCRGDGPTRTVYKDCSLPDLKKVVSNPWIDRPKP